MLECLQFIFSSFTIWLGTLILLSVIAGALATMFRNCINIKIDKSDKSNTWHKT